MYSHSRPPPRFCNSLSYLVHGVADLLTECQGELVAHVATGCHSGVLELCAMGTVKGLRHGLVEEAVGEVARAARTRMVGCKPSFSKVHARHGAADCAQAVLDAHGRSLRQPSSHQVVVRRLACRQGGVSCSSGGGGQ